MPGVEQEVRRAGVGRGRAVDLDAHPPRRALEGDLVVGVGLEPGFAPFNHRRHDPILRVALSMDVDFLILCRLAGAEITLKEGPMEREGGCACGAMRYRLTAPPLIVNACHCRDCQRLTGGAFAVNMWIERRFVEADHPRARSVKLTAGSGKPHEIFSCPDSGTVLWSKYHAALGANDLDILDADEAEDRRQVPLLEIVGCLRRSRPIKAPARRGDDHLFAPGQSFDAGFAVAKRLAGDDDAVEPRLELAGDREI